MQNSGTACYWIFEVDNDRYVQSYFFSPDTDSSTSIQVYQRSRFSNFKIYILHSVNSLDSFLCNVTQGQGLLWHLTVVAAGGMNVTESGNTEFYNNIERETI